jgi:transposase
MNMGALFEITRLLGEMCKLKSTEKLKQMKIDIRMGMTAKEIARKHNISEESARNYIRYYSKTLEKQKEMKLNA